MKVIVRLFARLRERLGTSRLELELEEGSTLGDILSLLFEENPRALMISVNNELTGVEHPDKIVLKDGDVVDLMPPASGG